MHDDEPAPRPTCGACGVANRIGVRFCRRCGGDLSEGAGELHPDRSDASLPTTVAGVWPEISSTLTFVSILLGTSLLGMGAVRWLGAPEVRTELGLAIVDAVVITSYALAHRRLLAPLLRPLLRPTWLPVCREIVVLGCTMGALAFVYFHTLRALGLSAPNLVEPFARAGWPVWAMFAFVSVLPSVVEETAFRGVVMGRLSRVLPARDAWFIQAALFAALHLSPVIFPSHFVIGLLLGRLRQRSNSLYPGMFVHAAYNAIILATDL